MEPREWWRQKVPKIFSPLPSMNYQKPTEHIEEEDVKRSGVIVIVILIITITILEKGVWYDNQAFLGKCFAISHF